MTASEMLNEQGQVTPLLWRDGVLFLLDQRLLPTEERVIACHQWQEVADAITGLAVRGAPAIGIAAAYAMVLASAADCDLAEASNGLAATRPTAVNLFWALDRMGRRISEIQSKGYTQQERTAQLLFEAQRIAFEDFQMCQRIGTHGATLLPERARVLTHCNAGALATGGSGTALAVIRAAWRQGRLAQVYADETRPLLQGARLTAWELHREHIPVRVICDNMAAHMMSRGMIDAVIVGTDRVAANGDIANKIGTLGLSILCAHFGLPFYVAAPSSTIDLSCPSGMAIPIEARKAEEVTIIGDRRMVPEGVEVENPAFDVTPARLITALITENGIISSPNQEALQAHLVGGFQQTLDNSRAQA